MAVRVHFHGPARYRLRSVAALGQSVLEASVRRALRGPRLPSWNWFLESATEMLKRRLALAFRLDDVREARRYLDSLVISSPPSEIIISDISHEKFRGTCFSPKTGEFPLAVLYIHGGGYSFYPKSYAYFITQITLAAKSKTFALDYPLSPEHRFPVQLECALNAYRWLLENGTNPEELVLAGDSAGANLALALLLAARDTNLPLPALVIALSPPTDFDADPASISEHQGFDWITPEMLERWRDWFCNPNQRRNPLVSPAYADLRRLPPIYIQAGRAEILYATIQAFVDRARKQGADVVLESWEDMNHVFQIFGPYVPQSAQALRRLGEVIDLRVRRRDHRATVFAGDL